jgi:ribonuclease Z
MRYLFEPRLVNDAFGDPALYVDFRDERRALLFDLGDISVLPPRKLMRLSHIFVTHAHMDHFAGFDHLLRVVLGRKANVVLFGGPEFVAQVEHKLRAHTWNVVHRYEVELVIDVHEIGVDGGGKRARFSSRRGFEREACASLELADDVLHEATFRVRGRFVDHDIACLSYAIEEKAHVNVGKDRVTALELSTGSWLRTLKQAVLTGAAGETPILVQWRDRHGEHAVTRQVSELIQLPRHRSRAAHWLCYGPPLHGGEPADAFATAGRR